MQVETAKLASGLIRLLSRKERILQVLVLVIGLALVLTLWLLRRSIATLELVGYPSVLFLSFLSSAAMVLPVPALASVCGLSLLLNPVYLGLLGGIGETVGELSGYAVGYGGKGFVERRGFYDTAKDWMAHRGTLILFLVSLIPNPVFDVVGIAAGATRFPLTRFLVTVWIGKSIKAVTVAYGCFYGLRLIPWLN